MKKMDLKKVPTTISNEVLMENFLQDLCTPQEIKAFEERWQIALLLNRGATYREVAEAVKVSTSTVVRVARFLKGDGQGYAKVIKKYVK